MLVQRIPEIVEEGDKLTGGARRPPGEAVEVRAQRRQGIITAAGRSEDGGNALSSFVRSRQIILPESHPNTTLKPQVAGVEEVSLEVGCVGQEGLEGGVERHSMTILTILPTTL
ncbi:tyrosyl-tRNA ligase, putative [Babesia ovata]|uniref:Tyrosyl-tRNA ligase, putative n=1 Tax=Babesia ovata TaxID=189622 RepID=A0A2H6KAS1_9APIC|nr:tyrosyl-tRNA ligase, putative [Babesia ovata]GBE60097.1 tyrosyl-tRNA ligase, putative [Babesia ovata]